MGLLTSAFEGGAAVRSGSPENPATSLSNPADWMLDAWGGGLSSAGERVNPHIAEGVSAWFNGVDIISGTLASMPMGVYRRMANGGRERARGERSDYVLRRRPNPEQTPAQWKKLMAAHSISWGAGFSEIEWRPDGQVRNLWPLLPDRTRAVRLDGVKYVVTAIPPGVDPPRGVGVINGEAYLPPGKYIHLPGISFDGISGINRVSKARETLGIALAGSRFQSHFFSQGLNPSMVATHPRTLKEGAQRRLRNQIENQASGLSNAHRLLVLEEGLALEKLGVSPEAAQFLQGRQFQVVEIARFLNIPLNMLQDYRDGASYRSIEAKQIDYVVHTILPLVVNWEQVLEFEIVPGGNEERGGELYVAFNLKKLMQGDAKTRGEFYGKLFAVGGLMPNEIRAQEDMNPVEGGDQAFVPANFITLDMATQPLASTDRTRYAVYADLVSRAEEGSLVAQALLPDATRQLLAGSSPIAQARFETLETPELAESPEAERMAQQLPSAIARRSAANRRRFQLAHLPVMHRAAERFTSQEIAALRRIIKRAFAEDQAAPLDNLNRELERFWRGDFRNAIRREMVPAVAALLQLLQVEIEAERQATIAEGAADTLAGDFVDSFVDRHIGRSQGQFAQLVEENTEAGRDAVQSALELRLDDWEERRAAAIARNEVTKAGGFLARSLYTLVGVTLFRWVTVGDSCPWCNRLAGRVVGVDEPFLRDGDKLDPEQEGIDPRTIHGDKYHAPAHRDCDCMVAPG